MSFGWSATDLVAVVRLAWRAYVKCRDAPSEYSKLRDEVFAFHSLLDPYCQNASAQPPPSSQSDVDAGSAWNSILATCKALLDQVLRLLEDCPRLASRVWDRIRFARMNLEPIRQQLHVYISILDSHIGIQTGRLTAQIHKDVTAIKVDGVALDAGSAELLRRLEEKLKMVLQRTDLAVTAQIAQVNGFAVAASVASESRSEVLQGAQHKIELSLQTALRLPTRPSATTTGTSRPPVQSLHRKVLKPHPNAGWSTFFLNGVNYLVIEDLHGPTTRRNYFRKPPILEAESPSPLPLGWFRVESSAGRIYYTYPDQQLLTLQHPVIDLGLLPVADYMSSGSYLASAGWQAADLVRARQVRYHNSGPLVDCGIPCELSRRFFRIINEKLYFHAPLFGCSDDAQWSNCDVAPGEPQWRRVMFGLSLATLREIRSLTIEGKEKLSGTKYGNYALDMLETYRALMDSNIPGNAFRLDFWREFAGHKTTPATTNTPYS